MPADGIGRIWRWPLHSTRRFFSCVLVVVMGVVLLNMVFGGSGSPGPEAEDPNGGLLTSTTPGTPTPTDTGASGTSIPTDTGIGLPATSGGVTPTGTPRSPAADAGVKAGQTAALFTTAWADHARPAPVWLADVSRYADPEFAAQLKSTDPANVPASKVTGQPVPVAVYYASASVELGTDAGVVVVELVNDGSAWRVTDITLRR